jgi:RHS repeat-associated protein
MISATATTSAGVATTSTYTYDADDLRLSRTTAGTMTRFAYDQSGSVPLLIKEGGIDYIYGPDGRPIEHVNTDNTGATYYTRDQHGDTRILTDQTGAVTATYTHTPFGVSTRGAGGTASTPLLYGAGHTDAETGLIYLIHRYYDPTTGNFARPDPLLALTGSPYSYVDHDPLNSLDPTGLCEASDAVGGALDFFGVDRSGFCDFGAGGTAAVNQLGGGIVAGLTPDSVSDAYNQHVGIDSSTGWYTAVEKTTFWGSMLYGGTGLLRGGIRAGIKFCPRAGVRGILNSNNILRVGSETAGGPIGVSIGAAPKHWAKLPAWRQKFQPFHVHMERQRGGITHLPSGRSQRLWGDWQ